MTSHVSTSHIYHDTLIAQVWPAQQTDSMRLLRAVVLAVLGSAFIAISAKISVPMVPVPMTMQTFAILVVGMAFGFRLGTATVLLYLAEGLAGLPVFAGPVAGPAYLVGPTGGYLAGFVVAAAIVGWLGDKGWDRSVVRTLLANAIGTACIFALGFAWLSTLIGADKAFAAGVLPFLIGAAAKIGLAAALLPMLRKWFGNRQA